MTRPTDSYYEAIIRRSLRYRIGYRAFRWRRFYSAGRIRSFSWTHGGEIYTFQKDCLTVQKAPVSPHWQVPDVYNRPVSIPLSPAQVRSIRKALEKIPFSRMKTTACSFVNRMEDGMIAEDLCCRFLLGGCYRFADTGYCRELEPLEKILEKIADTSEAYGKIRELETWLFTEQRWDQLQKKAKERKGHHV